MTTMKTFGQLKAYQLVEGVTYPELQKYVDNGQLEYDHGGAMVVGSGRLYIPFGDWLFDTPSGLQVITAEDFEIEWCKEETFSVTFKAQTLFDDASTRKKYEVMSKLEAILDDSRNELPEGISGLGAAFDDFIEFGETYDVTVIMTRRPKSD